MSTPPSEEMLAQRQLRAAEIALETARRRRRETDELIRTLGLEAETAQRALAEVIAERERDRDAFDAQVRALGALAAGAEQRRVEERNRRVVLEQQLAALRREETRRDDLARQLAAEARIAELEGELELVSRLAAEFEYGIRMAAFDAFKLVRDMAEKVAGLVSRARLDEIPREGREQRGVGVTPRVVSQPADHGRAPTVEDVLDSQRLDAALDRLRATTPPPEDEGPAE